tara:strand:+ start:72 stop:614 length:543 start_codon:yes stop_codon:yes gene_type:complete
MSGKILKKNLMTSKDQTIIQSFYPNKLAFFAGSTFFAGCTIVIFHIINNPGDYRGGRIGLFLESPVEIQYLIVLLSLLMTLLPLATLLPNSTYVRITHKGILYKGFMSLFKEKNLSWKVIDDFYIHSVPTHESTKYVKINFKKTYLPNYAEENLIIYGNPNKVLNIMKGYLKEYSKKDPK